MTASFAAIVRTTGSRPELLLDTLQSLSLQALPCHAIVVVHGDDQAYSAVKRTCEDSSAHVTVLHAPSVARRRGYPINLGLDYCAANLPDIDFLFFLDDDDIVYPFFTGTMAAAFGCAEADVVYASSNRRTLGQPTEPGYTAMPILHIFRENFIPINSYAMRHSALIRSGARMSEDWEYTEDWHFLLQLLEAGLRFHSLAPVLSEFRMVSDGNLLEKRNPALWKAISLEIRRFINTSLFPISGADLARWADSNPAAASLPGLQGIETSAAFHPADRARIGTLQDRVYALENSLSWRCTAPLRQALGFFLAFGPRGK
jgi:hypothetical protein